MQQSEAKEIFAPVLKNECLICHAEKDKLCDTQREWVHEERIEYAYLENDRYLRIVALKKMPLPKYTPTLGDTYASVADSAQDFYELFTAFNREAMRMSNEVVQRPSLSARGLYLSLLTTVKRLEHEFEQLTVLYQQANASDEDRARYAELAISVAKLNRDFDRFSDAMKVRLEQDTSNDRSIVHLRDAFKDLRAEYLHFALDYRLFANDHLNENLASVFETFAQSVPEDGPNAG